MIENVKGAPGRFEKSGAGDGQGVLKSGLRLNARPGGGVRPFLRFRAEVGGLIDEAMNWFYNQAGRR